jgi:hypothetical protein
MNESGLANPDVRSARFDEAPATRADAYSLIVSMLADQDSRAEAAVMQVLFDWT